LARILRRRDRRLYVFLKYAKALEATRDRTQRRSRFKRAVLAGGAVSTGRMLVACLDFECSCRIWINVARTTGIPPSSAPRGMNSYIKPCADESLSSTTMAEAFRTSSG
jgi:hypothetical protein